MLTDWIFPPNNNYTCIFKRLSKESSREDKDLESENGYSIIMNVNEKLGGFI